MLTLQARATFRTPTGRQAKIPARVINQPGLDAGRIARLRHRAEKMSRKNNASFATIFFAKVLAALSEHGLANISIRQVMQLAQQANEMPPELALACGCFIAAHPPATDFHGMEAAIKLAKIGGVPSLVQMHRWIIDKNRKKDALRRSKQPKLTNRPILLPKVEREKRKQQAEAEARAEQAEPPWTRSNGFTPFGTASSSPGKSSSSNASRPCVNPGSVWWAGRPSRCLNCERGAAADVGGLKRGSDKSSQNCGWQAEV